MEQQTTFFRLPVLVQLDVVMRCAAPRLASVPHVADMISAYLDVSVLFTPPQATARNNLVGLLERVLTRAIDDPAVDDAFRGHWLARAMEIAIQHNSLSTVEQIHRAHRGPLHVRSLQLALQHGTLKMVQWVVENRNDRRCCAPGLQNLCVSCLNEALPLALTDYDTEAIVNWLVSMGVSISRFSKSVGDGPNTSSLHRNATIARWLDARGELDSVNLIADVISSGPPEATDTLRYLIERGHSIPDEHLIVALARGACQPALEPLVDAVITSRLCDAIRDKFVWAPKCAGGAKVLQWDATFFEENRTTMGHSIAFHAATYCHVETLAWLLHDHNVEPPYVPVRKPRNQDDLLALYEWMDDTVVDGWYGDETACAGSIATTQWLSRHMPDHITEQTMDMAAAHGHVDIVQWLHTKRSEGCSDVALRRAAQHGHLAMVQWLSAHRREGDTNGAMVMAAAHGHLDVLVWLHTNRNDACGTCVLRSILHWVIMHVDGHADVPAFDPLRWLTRHATQSPACVGHCAPHQQQFGRARWTVPAVALFRGDLAVAQFLWEHYGASFRVESVEAIVEAGHLAAIQWLYGAAPETVDWALVLRVARKLGRESIATYVESTLATPLQAL